MVWEEWDGVAVSANGIKKDYAIEGKTIGRGGQATVSRALHRATGIPVAFKRLLPGWTSNADALARMSREVLIGTTFRDPHVVPVLDADPRATWFVMPLASSRLDDHRGSLAHDDTALEALVRQVCSGLALPHAEGWAHRDIKPDNILRFGEESSGRWAVADWGLGRRPPGTTTSPGRTVVGLAYGTEGFAAPEQGVDAHSVTLAADIFSVGQLIGWVLTGRNPQPNIPLLPASGPWRSVVEGATRMSAVRRPQTVDDFLAVLDAELAPLPGPPVSRREELLERATAGDPASGIELMELAAASLDDEELLIEMVPQLGIDVVRLAVSDHQELLSEILAALLAQQGDYSYLSWATANRVVEYAARCYAQALDQDRSALGHVALEAACAWDDAWDRWGAQRILRSVLKLVRGPWAEDAARVLRRYPGSAAHFAELADDKSVDPAVRGVLGSIGR